MKLRRLAWVTLITITCLATACKQNNKTGRSAGGNAVEEVTLPTRPEITVREERFVAYVIENNAEELALIHSALKKGAETDLRNEAQKMLEDHQKTDTEWTDYAKRKGVVFENLDVIQIVDIDEDQGSDWDKDWIKEMRTRHRRMIKRFERAQEYVQEKELKTMVNNKLPALRKHLETIQKLRAHQKNRPATTTQ